MSHNNAIASRCAIPNVCFDLFGILQSMTYGASLPVPEGGVEVDLARVSRREYPQFRGVKRGCASRAAGHRNVGRRRSVAGHPACGVVGVDPINQAALPLNEARTRPRTCRCRGGGRLRGPKLRRPISQRSLRRDRRWPPSFSQEVPLRARCAAQAGHGTPMLSPVRRVEAPARRVCWSTVVVK